MREREKVLRIPCIGAHQYELRATEGVLKKSKDRETSPLLQLYVRKP